MYNLHYYIVAGLSSQVRLSPGKCLYICTLRSLHNPFNSLKYFLSNGSTSRLICLCDENKGWLWNRLNTLGRRHSRKKKIVKCFKCFVESRGNSDFLVLVYLPEGFTLIAGDLLIESASFKEAN